MWLKGSIILVICSLLLLVVFPGDTAAEEEISPQEPVSKLKINYQARQKFSPELAVITLAVETKNQDLNIAYDSNSQLAEQVKEELASISEVEIISADYRIDLDESGPKEKKSTSYIVQNQIKVRVINLGKLGGIIETAIQAGANRVAGINYKLGNYDRAVQQVTAQALQGLQEKAKFIAQEMELKVKKVLELQVRENNSYHRTAAQELKEGQIKAADSSQPVVAPQKIEIKVTARGVYQLK